MEGSVLQRAFKSIPYSDYWPFPVVLLVVVLVSAWGRNKFLRYGNVLLAITGLHRLLFPSNALDMLTTGKLDPVHVELNRVLGVAILMFVIYCYFLLSSTDCTVEATLLLGFVIALGLQLLNAFHAFNNSPKKKSAKISQQGIYIAMFAESLWFAVSLLYYLSMKDRGGYAELPSQRNFHLRLNFLSFFLIGVLLFVFPAVVIKFMTSIKNIDSVHTFLSRILGASLICHGVVAAQTTNFLREADKISVLIGHIASLTLMMSSLLCSALMYSEFRCLGNIAALGAFFLMLINSVLGTDFGLFCKQYQMGSNLKNIFKFKQT